MRGARACVEAVDHALAENLVGLRGRVEQQRRQREPDEAERDDGCLRHREGRNDGQQRPAGGGPRPAAVSDPPGERRGQRTAGADQREERDPRLREAEAAGEFERDCRPQHSWKVANTSAW